MSLTHRQVTIPNRKKRKRIGQSRFREADNSTFFSPFFFFYSSSAVTQSSITHERFVHNNDNLLA